jgi:sugar lactone lactonase YvrE
MVAALGCQIPTRPAPSGELSFPVTPELFIDQFAAAEGITFNGQGQLFIGADRAVWRATPDGSVTRLADVYTNLGQAGIGQRDILAADFGLTNIFRDGANDDGIVWRISPSGDKLAVAKGIADPNFILVREDGSYLVSDDGTDKIYLVDTTSKVSVWSDAIEYPNGMVLSLDGSTLYVAQIFKSLDPIELDMLLIRHAVPPPSLLPFSHAWRAHHCYSTVSPIGLAGYATLFSGSA